MHTSIPEHIVGSREFLQPEAGVATSVAQLIMGCQHHQYFHCSFPLLSHLTVRSLSCQAFTSKIVSSSIRETRGHWIFFHFAFADLPKTVLQQLRSCVGDFRLIADIS